MTWRPVLQHQRTANARYSRDITINPVQGKDIIYFFWYIKDNYRFLTERILRNNPITWNILISFDRAS
jgi:hypothetical protein